MSGSEQYVMKTRPGTSHDQTHLVVANQPETRRLVVLIVGDHDVVGPHLQQIAFRDFDFAGRWVGKESRRVVSWLT